MGSLEVLKIGTQCSVGEDIKAIISAINIRYGNNITYELVWWSGRERKSLWMHEDEFQLVNTEEKVVVGFR